MRPIRNRKTVEKKTYKNPVIKTLIDTVVSSGAYGVNYTYFITGFMTAMDLAFVSSSICLN